MRKDTLLHGDLCSFKKYHLKTLQLVTHDRLIWTTYGFYCILLLLTTFLRCFFECLRPCVFLSEDSGHLSVLTEWWSEDFGELCNWCRFDLNCWTFKSVWHVDLNFNETVQAGVGISSNFCETCWRNPSAGRQSIIGGHWVGFWQLCGHLWASVLLINKDCV